MPWIVFVACYEYQSLGGAALKGRLAKRAASWKRKTFSEIQTMDNVELVQE
jgi:hypothetical protein